jgi:hypothetical protein
MSCVDAGLYVDGRKIRQVKQRADLLENGFPVFSVVIQLAAHNGQAFGLLLGEIQSVEETPNFIRIIRDNGCMLVWPIGRVLELRIFPPDLAPTLEDLSGKPSEEKPN